MLRFGFRIELNLFLAVGGQAIVCASAELVPIVPPNGLTCAEYMDPFISYAGGYLNATSSCLYCPFQTTDQYMYAGFNIQYSHRWRDVGIMLGVTVFNVSYDFCCSPWVFTKNRTFPRSSPFSLSPMYSAFGRVICYLRSRVSCNTELCSTVYSTLL